MTDALRSRPGMRPATGAPVPQGAAPPLRLCLIGDSHLAALRLGWQAAPLPGLAPRFFPVRAAHLSELAPEGGTLRVTGPGARADWAAFGVTAPPRLASFDLFAVVGGGFGSFRAIDIYARARFAALPDAHRATAQEGGPALVSRGAFVAATADCIARAPGPRLALALARACPGRPVLLVAQPAPLAPQGAVPPPLALHAWAERVGDGPGLHAALEEAAARVAGRAGVLPLWQPEETRRGALFTDPRLGAGAPRLDPDVTDAQPAGDFLHANAAYGAQVMAALAARAARLSTAG